jgi:hypothetical protein
VKGCVLIRISSRHMTWQHGFWCMNSRFTMSGLVRHLIAEVIRESDELEHFLLSRGLGKSRTFKRFSGVNEVPVAETR